MSDEFPKAISISELQNLHKAKANQSSYARDKAIRDNVSPPNPEFNMYQVVFSVQGETAEDALLALIESIMANDAIARYVYVHESTEDLVHPESPQYLPERFTTLSDSMVQLHVQTRSGFLPEDSVEDFAMEFYQFLEEDEEDEE